MGMIGTIIGALFGGGRNVITQTMGAFRPNAEAEATRTADYQASALGQFGREFDQVPVGWFDRLVNDLNRLPRPLMALGTIALFVSAMWNPIWFASRMQGLVLVPDQLWWLLGAIVTFYFGARYQAKAIDASRILKQTPKVLKNIEALRSMTEDSPGVADTGADSVATIAVIKPTKNQAVVDWGDKGRP